MRSINKVMLLGNLASDPQLIPTKTGKTAGYFILATNQNWITANGEKAESADFHKVVLWQKLAEIALKFLTKGSRILVEGRIRQRSYTDAEGKMKYSVEIVAKELYILSWLKDENVDEPKAPELKEAAILA